MQVDKSAIRSGALVPMVAVLSNPYSTTNAAGMDKVRSVVSESANVVHYELKKMGDIDDALALFAKANPSVLVINGGDGTIGAVLAALMYRNPFSVIPPIAFLPGGKTNMTAADLGFRGCPSKNLDKVLSVVKSGNVGDQLISKRLIELDLNDGSEPRVGTFFGTAGVVNAIFWCRVNAYGKGLPNWLAHMWSFFMMTGGLLGIGSAGKIMKSDKMSIKPRGSDALEGEFSVVLASTLDRVLMGLRPFGTSGTGGLQFSAVKNRRTTALRGLLGLITGDFGKGKVKGVNVGRSDELVINGKDPVTLDGEIFYPDPEKPMTLKGSRSLTFLKI